MMPDAEWEALKQKIEWEFPIRIKLAELLGRKINPKNYNACMAFDDTIPELLAELALKDPMKLAEAFTFMIHGTTHDAKK